MYEGVFGKDIFSKIEIDVNIQKFQAFDQTFVDVLPFVGSPKTKDDYKAFLEDIKTYETYEDEDYDNPIVNNTKPLDNIIPNIKHIYTYIDYPLERGVVSHYELPENSAIKYSTLLYANACAYKDIYRLEDEQECKQSSKFIPGMLNRIKTQGPFGIWGHVIDDLDYNGSSEIIIKNDAAWCYFDCDS